MIIVVTGPECSGTRAMTRILREAGAVVFHRPVPMTISKNAIGPVWPDFNAHHPDAIIVMQRGLFPCAKSQVNAGFVKSLPEAIERIRLSLSFIAAQLEGNVWYPINYEWLVESNAIDEVLNLLNLQADSVTTVWRDANKKYYSSDPRNYYSNNAPLA